MRRPAPRSPLRRIALPALLLVAAVGATHAARDARAEDAPAIRFDLEEYDFGICQQNKEYPAELTYRNVGTRTVQRIRVKSDCGCYAATADKTSLTPGETATLRVRFRTLSLTGTVKKRLRLLYEDDGLREASVVLKVNIFGGVVLVPGRLHFGEVLVGTRPAESISVAYYEGVGRPFEVKSIDVAGEPIATGHERWVNPENERWKGWKIHFAFTKPLPRGVYSKKAIVHTTSERTPRVIVPITAHVVGKVWVQTHRVHLGLVPQGETRSAWINFRPFDGTIRLGRVSARSRKGVLVAQVEEAMGSRGPTTRLRVSIPPNAPVGSLDDVIELRTEVPGEEVTEIEVRGRIFKKVGG